MQQDQPITFFQERLLPLGVNEETNKIRITNPEAEYPSPKTYDTQIFSETPDGDISILYWTLDRELITYYQVGDGKMSQVNAKQQYYHQIRLKEPKGDRKYLMPSSKFLKKEGNNSTFPWFAPEICEAFAKKEEVETIFLTEGVFKAWMGCKMGMPTVGLSSITHYAGKDGKLYYDLIRLIDLCCVQNVVILWDGDCLDISEAALSKREDILKRPLGFYAAAKKICRLVQQAEYSNRNTPPDIHFYHIKSKENENAKGLDDLFLAQKGSEKAIVKQALDVKGPSVYFRKFDISETTVPLHEYFGLKDREKFYRMHSDKIQLNEFKYDGDWLRWDDEKEELTLISPKWAENTFWIGDEYFRVIEVPSARKGKTRKELKPYNQSTLEKTLKKGFWKYLENFAGFCNVPDHKNYKQVIELHNVKFYNRYFPFKHVSKNGEWPTILNFIKHIFGEDEVLNELSGEKIPRWKLGLDYIQILYQEPTAMLPVLILFSQENGTGKSTFGRLMSAIFGDNVVPIGNADLQSDFNETYSDKLLAICEETLLERKKEAERIKSLSTNPKILVNPKGQKQYQIDFFCKFIFMSNNPRMIYLTRHDTRYWILKIPQFQREIPDFAEMMEAEIPAFLHFLDSRKLATEREGRMHFHPSLLKTDALEETIKVNEPSAASDMREEIIQLFLHDKDLQEIEMPLKEIRETFFSPSTSAGWVREILRDYIRVGQVMGADGKPKLKRGTFPFWEKNGNGELVRKDIEYRGRPYLFKRAEFVGEVNPADYEEIAEVEAEVARIKFGGERVVNKSLTDKPKQDLPF